MTCARNLELITGNTDPESILRSAWEEPTRTVQVPMHEYNNHFSVATHEKIDKRRFEHWLKKTSTAQEAYWAKKIPAATDIFKTEVAV